MGNLNAKKSTAEPEKDEGSTCSSPPLPRSRLFVDEDQREAFCLIWLDEHAHSGSLESLHTQTLLRQINHKNSFFFNEPKTFLEQISTLADNYKKILLVISGHLASKVLSQIHVEVCIIIIFCHVASRYTVLQSKHTDVVHICTSHEELRSSILSELSSSKFRLFENQILKTVVPLNSSNGIANDCIHRSYISFIQLLKEMPRTEKEKEIMLSKCEDYCRGQRASKEMIECFRKTYKSSTQAIDWYLKDSFVYRLVNRAFRTQDVSLWYIFRYYIADLCTEIERVHKEQKFHTALTLYRGQPRMHCSELDYLRSNIGCLVSTIGFLSTSTRIEMALGFNITAVDTDEYKVVLFQIIVDQVNLENTVFVDVEQYNPQSTEGEVLFNVGSVFRVEDVSLHVEGESVVWLIKMRATDERTQEIKQKVEKKKQTFDPELINLTFGRFLIEMHEYFKAESYFQILIKNLSSTHSNLPLIHNQLGDLYMRLTNWQQALQQFTKAAELQKKTSSPSMLSLTWNNFGNYYKAIDDYEQALQYYTKALECSKQPSNRMRIQLNIAAINGIKGEYEKAKDLSEEVQMFFHQLDPRPDDELVHCLGVIANIHIRQKKYKKAEDYYTTAMEMAERVLLIGHRLRISAITSLADLYVIENRKQEAIELCQDKLVSYEQCLSANHLSIAHLSMKLGEFYDDDDVRKIVSLQRALTIFESSAHLDYAATSDCYLRIAEFYKQSGLKLAERVRLIGNRLGVSAIRLLANLDVRHNPEQEAFELCQDKLASYEQCLPANHPNAAHFYMKLDELDNDDDARNITFLRRRLTMFKDSIHLDYAAASDRYLRMAEYCQQHGFDQAYPYYARAMKIQEKIYPKDHPKVRKTRSMMEVDHTQD